MLFLSQQPVLPFSHKSSAVVVSNIKSVDIDLAFALATESEIFQIGIELENAVFKKLRTKTAETKTAAAAGTAEEAVKMELAPKKSHKRVKIIEVEVTPNGVFVKTIPYKDKSSAIAKPLMSFNMEK